MMVMTAKVNLKKILFILAGVAAVILLLVLLAGAAALWGIRFYNDMFGKEPDVRVIHAGLECGLIGEKYQGMDMISYGPTLRGVHSPEERLEIATVDLFWRHTLDILKNI